MCKSQNLDLFLRIYFNLSLLLSFFPLPFLFISSFLGDKKDQQKFLSGSFENWLSIFVSSLSFELSQLFLYMWRFVFMGIAPNSVN